MNAELTAFREPFDTHVGSADVTVYYDVFRGRTVARVEGVEHTLKLGGPPMDQQLARILIARERAFRSLGPDHWCEYWGLPE